MQLERDFGISGPLLGWIRSYLSERQQFTIVNGSTSEMIPVSFGIPQGSVLGPTLFTLFTNDLPSSVSSGSVYMFADDTTVYCISETAEQSIVLLNSALRELRTFAPIATAHPYSARKFTCHVMHRARALSTKMNNDRGNGHCYSFAWI